MPLLAAAGTPADPARVIIVSSVAGLNVPHTGENGTIMYSVSKAAAHVSISHFNLSFLLQVLEIELNPYSILVEISQSS
jgi:NAD(P)-dependent dehydrogenase (short-subunit alcohol dehydrogenase family)